jgi:actin-like ATPase involved in cell morphogenesis
VPYQLGVDLGTTFTSAAVARDGRVQTINLTGRTPAMPSVVLIRENGEVLVGEAAASRAALEPTRGAREFKRRLGDPSPIMLGGAPYRAEALTGYLLRAVYQRVVERMGEPPDRVVLTHPASYSPQRLELLRDAARRAGVGEVELLSEAAAGAIHYAAIEPVPAGAALAVYDFGGGSFEAAVVRRNVNRFDLLGTPQSVERLGGVDLDLAVLGHVDEQLGGQLSGLDPNDPQNLSTVARARLDSRTAKEVLSHDREAIIPVTVGGVTTNVTLTRPQLEQLIRPRIAETTDALQRAVVSSGLTLADIDRVLLVGGSSRIPLVRDLVARVTSRPIATDPDPEHAVAMGAAAAASGLGTSAIIPPPVPAILVSDVPHPTSGPVTQVVPAVPPTQVTPVIPPGPPGPPTTAVPYAPDYPPPPDRRQWWWIAGIAAAVLLIGGAIYALTRGGDSDDSAATTVAATTTAPATTAATTTLPPTTTTIATTTTPAPTTTAAPTTAAPTTTQPPPPTLSPDEAALQQLNQIRDGDAPLAESLVGTWVPQISSKYVGLQADGITYTPVDILDNHQQLADQYQAILISSNDYISTRPDTWISIIPIGSSDPDSALNECVVRQLDRDNCLAKLITHDDTIDPNDTVKMQP